MSLKASTVVAVPKSSTTRGFPYFSIAATQETDRSAPRWLSLSYSMPGETSSSTIIGFFPKYFTIALVRVYITWGTTEAMMISHTWSVVQLNRRKYSQTVSPISSDVRLVSVIKRKLPTRVSPSSSPNTILVFPTSMAISMAGSSSFPLRNALFPGTAPPSNPRENREARTS